MVATVATLFFVPAVFSLLHGMKKPGAPQPVPEDDREPVQQGKLK
jgi:hypothetical protein